MTNGRKTTYEKKVEIVKYCIEHENNYAETAQKYQIFYLQISVQLRIVFAKS